MLATSLLVVGPAPPALAQDCAEAATQVEMNACADRAYQAADADLNATYREITGRLQDDGKRALLVAAQRAWIAFRDAECSFATSGVAGGSIRPMLQAACLADLTERRTRELARYLECAEGDLSCPVP